MKYLLSALLHSQRAAVLTAARMRVGNLVEVVVRLKLGAELQVSAQWHLLVSAAFVAL